MKCPYCNQAMMRGLLFVRCACGLELSDSKYFTDEQAIDALKALIK